MLEQIVYTRCKPHRSLKDNGKINDIEGFGVFSFSEGLLSKDIIGYANFINDYSLYVKNVSDESEKKIGLIESYDYIFLNEKISAISNQYPRPKGTVPRKNGIGHRAGNFITQAYIGSMPELYPFEFFGSKIWNAKHISENDYYLDDEENKGPDFLNSIDIDRGFKGNIDKKQVLDFVATGNRKECLIDALWFLIGQFSKPENARKILLIKDLPQNVEMWIAAIMLGFPKYLAKKISFSTNRVIELARITDTLFYNTDETGKIVRQTNRMTKRQPLFMIVGYHPSDSISNLVESKPNEHYAILDGQKLVMSSSPTARETLSPYYEAVINNGQDIDDFCQIVLPEIQITEISDRIPIVYRAYDYLLNSENKPESWNYQQALSLFKVFLQNGIEKSVVLSENLLDNFTTVYNRFVEDDIENNLSLLRDLYCLASQEYKEALEAIVLDKLLAYINNINKYLKKILKLECDLNADDSLNNLKCLFYKAFDDNFLLNYVKLQLSALGADSIYKVFELYCRKLEFDKINFNTLIKEESKYNFFFSTTRQIWITKSGYLLKQLLSAIKESDLFTDITLNFYKTELCGLELEKRKDFNEFIVKLCGDILDTAIKFCDYKDVDIGMLERFIADWILIEGKCDEVTRSAFEHYIDNTESTNDRGKQFFNNWIEIANRTDIFTICLELSTCNIDNSLKKQLLFETCRKCIPGFSLIFKKDE